jgi:ribulose bisphosphate carboxylase small subunit
LPEEAEQVTGTPMKQRCGIYARVSTREKGQDTENQLFQLREYCARQGWTIAHEYMDHESAKTGTPQIRCGSRLGARPLRGPESPSEHRIVEGDTERFWMTFGAGE